MHARPVFVIPVGAVVFAGLVTAAYGAPPKRSEPLPANPAASAIESVKLAMSHPRAVEAANKAAQPSIGASGIQLEGRKADELVYPFVIGPRRIELSPAQVEEIRRAAVDQVVTYHLANAALNQSSADSYKMMTKDSADNYALSTWARKYQMSVFESQNERSGIIFYFVLVIVALSLVITIHQFFRDSSVAGRAAGLLMRRRGKIAAASASNAESHPPAKVVIQVDKPEDATEELLELYKSVRAPITVVVGPQGVQIGSQVVGLAMMAFALAFFYLYLYQVYPISGVNWERGAPPLTAQAPQSKADPVAAKAPEAKDSKTEEKK